jgi:hypothetical protein
MPQPAMPIDAPTGRPISGDGLGLDGVSDLLALGRRGHHEELARLAQQERSSGRWSAVRALEFAVAWLLAGDRRQADLALLEADRCDPFLCLVPDVWGLWPLADGPTPTITAERRQALELAELFQHWRRPDAQALWQQVLPQLQANWRNALEAPLGDALLILGRASAAPGAPAFDPPFESALVQLVADTEIAAEPAASSRFWQLVATIRPDWDLARIRAADLALGRGDLQTSARWLAESPEAALCNPWFHDVAARQAVARGDVAASLPAWAEAIRTAQADEDTAPLAGIFEQRRREARRGPGVLQVRSLASQGDHQEAVALLELLQEEDPQWQPFRSLREQLQASQPQAHLTKPHGDANPPATTPQASPSLIDSTTFGALLEQASVRLRALGLPVPSPTPQTAVDVPTLTTELSELDLRFSDYEARFALA